MKEIKHETFRSGSASFEKNVADYLIGSRKDHWKASKCPFFQTSDEMKSWAVCFFER